jgi:hypothetical protein
MLDMVKHLRRAMIGGIMGRGIIDIHGKVGSNIEGLDGTASGVPADGTFPHLKTPPLLRAPQLPLPGFA